MSKNHKNSRQNFDKNSGNKKDTPVNSEQENIENNNETPENMDIQSGDEIIADINDSPEEEIETLKNLLQQKEEEIQKEKKDYLFLMADFDNFRKRTIKEKSELVKTGSESVLKQLLPVVDDFERGLEAMKSSNDVEAIKEGMELVYNKFIKFFDQNGVKAIESTGKEFDTELHEALTTIPVQEEDMKNKIVDTITKGYTLNDKVIRHAKVVVGN